MSKLLYAVMYTEYAEFLGSGAPYVDSKVLLKGLTESEIAQFDGEVNRIDQLGFNPDGDTEQTGLSTAELSDIVNQLAEQEANEKLGVLSIPQGKWLYANHPDFMPETQQ
jgi:hypothetical protein